MSKPTNGLPRGIWLPLGPSLAWLAFKEYREISDLETWATEAQYVTVRDIQTALGQQWGQLADYASRKEHIEIRARRTPTGPEVKLSTDELRNYKHVSWHGPGDLLTRNEPTWSGAFADHVTGDPGLALPVVAREELLKYKQMAHLFRPRAQERSETIKNAQAWLGEKLDELKPQMGLQQKILQEMQAIYPLPEYVAIGIWRDELNRRPNWPRQGAPKKETS